MSAASNTPDQVNRRHLTGYRKFQRAALKALEVVMAGLETDDASPAPENTKARTTSVKPADMKPLVAAYNDAVVGERMVLGMDGKPGSGQGGESFEWPKEVTVRWVDDDEQAVPDVVGS